MSDKDTVKINKTANKRKKSNRTKGIFISALLCFAAAILILLATILFYKPIFDNKIPFDTDPFDKNAGNSGDIKDARENETCNFLVLGWDKSGGMNTDVMIIASYNIGEGVVNMVQVPRDTYVNVGTSSRKINSLFASFYLKAKREKAKDPYDTAVKQLIDVFQQNLCVKIHNYITMDLDGFANIVDAIGGVNIDLPSDLYYHDSTPGHELYIDLKAGPQTLDGKKAEQFVRFRMGYKMADVARMDAQKLFIAAFIKQLKNSFSLSTVVELTEQAVKNIKTDLSVADCIYFAKKALSVDLANVSMMTLPGTGQFSEAGTAFYIIHRTAALEMVNKYLNIYEIIISDKIFDKNVVFCNLNDNKLKIQYYKDACLGNIVIADDPKIDIPLLGE